MGTTRLIHRRNLIVEPTSDLSHSVSHKHEFSVVLDNIRSAWNVGSILRSAEGFGFTHAYLCGITPTPANDAVKKTSLGAEDSVPWTSHKDALKVVEKLKLQGDRIAALEEHENAIPLIKGLKKSTNPTVLIVGNEITGIDPDLIDLCDEIYHIPMLGEKKSFNVAIAFGIAAYALR